MEVYPGPPDGEPQLGKQGADVAPGGAAEIEDEDLYVPDTREHPPNDEDVTSIMAIIPNDHDRIKGLYRRYKDPTDTPHLRQQLAWQLLRELTVHTHAEEAVLYPVVAERIEAHMRDHALDEHESLALFTSDLESMKLGDEGFEDKMHQLMETFLEHIHEEEHSMLPALREALQEAELRELGGKFEAAKQHVPTRPHRDPTHKGYAAANADDATVLLDAARDAAQFGGTPPAIGSPSTEVLRDDKPAVV